VLSEDADCLSEKGLELYLEMKWFCGVGSTDTTARGLNHLQLEILSLLASSETTYPEIHSHFQASVLSDQLFCNLQTRYDFLKLFKHIIKV
jgi:hypothetical protein